MRGCVDAHLGLLHLRINPINLLTKDMHYLHVPFLIFLDLQEAYNIIMSIPFFLYKRK